MLDPWIATGARVGVPSKGRDARRKSPCFVSSVMDLAFDLFCYSWCTLTSFFDVAVVRRTFQE